MNKRISIFVAAFFTVTSVTAGSAPAESFPYFDARPDSSCKEKECPFSLSLHKDVPLFCGIALLDGAAIYLDKIAKINCNEYDGTLFDDKDVNGFDRMVMHPYSKNLDWAANGTAVASCLMPAVLFAAPQSDWLTYGTMYAQTMMLAYGVAEMGKLCTKRTRPYMYFDDYPEDDVAEGDWCNSFPSGHTTIAFAAATFTSYTFCGAFPDSPLKGVVVASSYSLALATAALRVSSGNHFMTDVLAGAVAGSACGFLVPFLHKKASHLLPPELRSDKMNLSVLPGGVNMSIRF